jgi:HEPN domain-containing protein
LKAYLIYQDKIIKKTHDLIVLQEFCSELDSDFEQFKLTKLDDFSVDIRYPDDAIAPTLEEAKEYLQIAEAVKELVRKKIIF